MGQAFYAPKRVARALLRRLGFDLVRHEDQFGRLAHLLGRERVTLVLDVGANDGPFVRELRRAGYRGRVVSFEPLSDAFARLQEGAANDHEWACYRVALAERDGSGTLHVSGNSSSSSLLEIRDRHVVSAPDSAYVRTEEVALARLDSLRGDVVDVGDRIFVKLDVQGYELPVLRGAQETLRQARAVQCELSLLPLYEGQALLPEVVDWLDRLGFDLISLDSVFRDPVSEKLLQVDGLFVRSRS